MKKALLIILIIESIFQSNAQTSSWQLLSNSPGTGAYRHDDVFFINDSVGWLVNNNGYIYRTNDFGINWSQQLKLSGTYFRCVGFADSLNGWAGNLGAQSWGGATDTNCLYQTHDGGTTWTPVTNITGPKPMGLCGINVFDAQHIYAVGRIEGPVHFMKSTDGGNSWTSQDMSSYCSDLVDVKFFSVDTGFIVGGTSTTFNLSHSVILKTTDGGNSWQTIYTSIQVSSWCWKQTWPSHNTGYVSMQHYPNGPTYFLKTTDGGTNWNENLVTSSAYFCQGIGFVNDSVGWIGGDFNNNNSWQTIDGGQSWTTVNIGHPLNRFRFTSPATGYSSGLRVYRYSPVNTAIPTNSESTGNYSVKLLSSNPVIEKATIEFKIPSKQKVNIELYDLAGRRVKVILAGEISGGVHQRTFEIPSSQNGIFFCCMVAGKYEKSILIMARH